MPVAVEERRRQAEQQTEMGRQRRSRRRVGGALGEIDRALERETLETRRTDRLVAAEEPGRQAGPNRARRRRSRSGKHGG